MSDKPDKKDAKKQEAAPAAGDAAAPAKKGLNVKLVGIVGALMAVQAGAVFMVARMTAPKAALADVQPAEDEHAENHEDYVEIPLLEERFQNMQSGRAFLWDVSLVLKVKAKDKDLVTKTLEAKAAEVKEGVALIFRRAPHTQLMEPGLETLNRQLLAYFNDVVEKDSDDKGRIHRVLIPKCKGFAAE